MRQSALCAAMFVTVLVGARDARAEQTAESCKEGLARAQHRESDGMLSAAREAYAGCAVADCPDGVRDDCAAALERLDKDKHEEEEESGRAIVGPLIVGGVGTVALIVAAVLHSNASANTAEADAVSPAQPRLDEVIPGGDNTQQLYEEDRLRRRADRYETAAIIVLGGGLLAITGAVIWHFASGSNKPAKASSVSFQGFSPVIRF